MVICKKLEPMGARVNFYNAPVLDNVGPGWKNKREEISEKPKCDGDAMSGETYKASWAFEDWVARGKCGLIDSNTGSPHSDRKKKCTKSRIPLKLIAVRQSVRANRIR
jgi:hypothetical protein